MRVKELRKIPHQRSRLLLCLSDPSGKLHRIDVYGIDNLFVDFAYVLDIAVQLARKRRCGLPGKLVLRLGELVFR